jgi:transposase
MIELRTLHLHWRVSHYKGKSYRSYSLARSYRHHGTNRKDIVFKLGKLSEEEAQRWRELLQAAKTPHTFLTTLHDLAVTHRYAYLDVAVANAIWQQWQLDAVFRHHGKRALGVATLARILTLNRCIDPAAKSKTPQWFRGTALPWLLAIRPSVVNPSRIFRELATIERHKDALCQHVFQRLRHEQPETMRSVFYDLSSTTFSGSRCVLMKWGHCKEGYHNHVVLALVVNGDGVPFYWEVLPGGTADVSTITWLLERLRQQFDDLRATVVFDRGMVSHENPALLEAAKIKYISAMDKNQVEGLSGIDFTRFSSLEPARIQHQAKTLPGFTPLNATTYYRDVKVDGQRRYILCFNPHLFTDQRQARTEAVRDFRALACEVNTELRAAKKSRQCTPTYDKFKRPLHKAKLADFVDVALHPIEVPGPTHPIRTYQGTVVVDEAAMRHAGRLDGFWLIVTNHIEKVKDKFRVPTPEVITPYQEKVVIESSFRDIKSFIDIAPVYVWTEAHVKAHYTICVLSHLINRTLTLQLHSHRGNTTQDIVSHERLYETLSSCQIDRIEVENVHLSTYNMTRPTPEQKELLERVGLMNLLSREVVDLAKKDAE